MNPKRKSAAVRKGDDLLRYTLSRWAAAAAAAAFLLCAANLYAVTDGADTRLCLSLSRQPQKIAAAAGFAAGENDDLILEGHRLTLQRQCRVRLLRYGTPISLISPGETVGQLLERTGMLPAEEDALSHDADTPVYDGMELRIDRYLVRQEEYTAVLPWESSEYSDPSLSRGQREVRIPGKEGLARRLATVTYRNGIEISRTVIREQVLQSPVTQVVSLGTGPEEASPSREEVTIGDGYIRLATGEVLTYSRTDTVRATGYTHTDEGCDTVTSTGTTVRRGTVAVDPRYIPYGTRMFIAASDGSFVYGIATAEDCGGAIKQDRMDLYFPTYEECIDFGKRRCTVYFLGEPAGSQ